MHILSLSNLHAGITVMGTPRFHGWQIPWPLPGSDGKEFPATGTHLFYPCITFLFHFSLFLFLFFWSWSPPLALWYVSHLFMQMVLPREVKKSGVPKSLSIQSVLSTTEQWGKEMRNWKPYFKAQKGHGSRKENIHVQCLVWSVGCRHW